MHWETGAAVDDFQERLTAAHSNDNFQLVTVSQALLGIVATRHDFTIALQSHALVSKRHGFEQL